MTHYFVDNRSQPDGAHEVHAVWMVAGDVDRERAYPRLNRVGRKEWRHPGLERSGLKGNM